MFDTPCKTFLLDQDGQVNLIFFETEDMGCKIPFHIFYSGGDDLVMKISSDIAYYSKLDRFQRESSEIW